MASYWRGAAEDEAMQDEHGFVWLAMLDTIDCDLTGRRVLDVGCNRGGFLRLLCDHAGIAAGCGYDPAAGAVEDARRLAGDRPLIFEVGDAAPAEWRGFDVAFSHEVIYLVPDLGLHAAAMRDVLQPGGVYFAVEGVHTHSARMAEWHRSNAAELNLPPLRTLDDYVAPFQTVGFAAAVSHLQFRFLPVIAHTGGHREAGDLAGWLKYYTEDKMLLRFTRPDA